MTDKLPDIVDVYWGQGCDGHRGESQVIPNNQYRFSDIANRLFEAGRDRVIIEDIFYTKTLDQAEIMRGEPRVHLRYESNPTLPGRR